MKKKHLKKKGGAQNFFNTSRDEQGNPSKDGNELRRMVFEKKDYIIKTERYLNDIKNRGVLISEIPHKYITKDIIIEYISYIIYDYRIRDILDEYAKEYIDKPDIDFMVNATIANFRCLTHDKISDILLNSKKYFILLVKNLPNFSYGLEKRPDNAISNWNKILTNKIRHAWDNFRDDKQFVLEIMSVDNCSKYFAHLTNDFKCDEDICKKAIEYDVFSYKHCCDEIKSDKDFCLFTIENHKNGLLPFSHFPLNIRDDDDICIKALQVNGTTIELCSERVKNNRSFAKIAIKQNPSALKYCSEKIKQDVDICLSAIKRDKYSFYHCNDKLKMNIFFGIEAVGINPEVLDFISRRVLLDPWFIKYTNKTLNEDIVRIISTKIISLDYKMFSYCAEDLQNDIDFCIYFLKLNPEIQENDYTKWLKTRVPLLPTTLFNNPVFKEKLISNFNTNIVNDIINTLKQSSLFGKSIKQDEWKHVKKTKKNKRK